MRAPHRGFDNPSAAQTGKARRPNQLDSSLSTDLVAARKNQACCSACFDFRFPFPAAFAAFIDLMRATAA